MWKYLATTLILAAGIAATVGAQPPGGPGGRGNRRGPGGPPDDGPGRGGPPPAHRIVEAIDADHDHVISAEEIKNAPAALAALDTNKDGKLDEDETRPEPPGDGPRRPPRGPRGDGPGPGHDRGPEGGPEGGFGGGPGGRGGPPREFGERGPQDRPLGPPDPDRFVEHALEFDVDKDGKLSAEELRKFAAQLPGPGGPGGPGGFGDDGPPRGPRRDRPRRP